MHAFAHAHASHPDWEMALGLVLAQLEQQLAGRPAPTLGWCYFSDRHAAGADALVAALRGRFPGVAWVGAVGIGVCASGVEYFDEPGVAVMLAALPPAQFRVFSGRRPLTPERGFAPHTALVHADPATPDLSELIEELSDRVGSGYLFGGLSSGRNRSLTIAAPAQAAQTAAPTEGVFEGGLSGVAFGPEVAIVSRVSQGCLPVGPVRRITAAERNVVYALDDQPALDCLLHDLALEADAPREALTALREVLVGLSDDEESAEFGVPVHNAEFATLARRGSFGTETRVRHLIGIDPQRRGIAIGELAEAGQQLAFCRRDTDAARRDLLRIGAEIRSALEPEELPLAEAGAATAAPRGGRQIVGAHYVSCTGRGGPHFGAPSAELQLVRHALGGAAGLPPEQLPLVGFFAAGEIGHHHLYGYTGVLTVFTAPA